LNPVLLDLRAFRCPFVTVRAREALAELSAGEALTVLATDREAPIDLGALAADNGMAFSVVVEDGGWRLVLEQRAGR
jgi:tRNA 2-thiouridine synthesizing protein A